MSWYRLELTDEEIRIGRLNKIQNDFMKMWLTLDANNDTALFHLRDANNNRDTLYIYSESKAHSEVFCRMFSAVSCDAPDFAELVPMVSGERLIERLSATRS